MFRNPVGKRGPNTKKEKQEMFPHPAVINVLRVLQSFIFSPFFCQETKTWEMFDSWLLGRRRLIRK